MGSDVHKWLDFCYKVPKENVPNISRIVGYLLSIPGSNAVVESVFSLMKWTDARNRSHRELIKAELQIAMNFSFTCKEFLQYVKRDKQLLKGGKTSR
jgi:hypothetical protein